MVFYEALYRQDKSFFFLLAFFGSLFQSGGSRQHAKSTQLDSDVGFNHLVSMAIKLNTDERLAKLQ